VSFDVEKLYSLLPAVYRIRDIELASRMEGLLTPSERAELQSLGSLDTLTKEQERRFLELEDKGQRGPLKSLLSVIAEQVAVLEEDLDQLYDNLFIETCAEWVVPYIGDLIGARGVFIFPGADFTERAFVANTMAYRRRKGTAAVLEQLARDVTGWNARAVEYFQLLATTQYLNHLRPENLSFASLRNSSALEDINTAFDPITRTADVRRIEPRRGRYNIPNVGLFLYPIDSFPVTNAPAFRVDANRFKFDALGRDIQLYNRVEPEDEITHLAEPRNVPLPLRRRTFSRAVAEYHGEGRSVLIIADGAAIPADQIVICNLSDRGAGWAHTPSSHVAIDPVLGRMAFPTTPADVRVGYHYGFSAEIGGGQYGRESTFMETKPPVKIPVDVATIQQAMARVAASGGAVEIRSNDYFFEAPAISITAQQGATVELRAAEEHRPVIVAAGDITIFGTDESEFTLNGLLVRGVIRVPAADQTGSPNRLRVLRLRHCTVAPGSLPAINPVGPMNAGPRLFIEAPDTLLEIESSIIGAIRAIDGARVQITNSIVDAVDQKSFAYSGLGGADAGAPLTIANTTIIGRVHTKTMTLASNTLFAAEPASGPSDAPIVAERLQDGCVRFSYVPPGSRLPRLHQCQPATAEDAARIRPSFVSTRYGDAGYCRLTENCAIELRRGADDGSEIGVFHELYQPQREANLRTSLDEYLRFGLEAGIFFAS